MLLINRKKIDRKTKTNRKTKILSFVIAMTALVLTACQSTPESTLTFVAPAPSVQFNTANQMATVNVLARDMRAKPEISEYVYDNKVHKLSASPALTQLFQQIFQQDLNGKGFRINNGAASNANLIVNIKDFYAQVGQGTFRYKVDAKIRLEVQVQGASGQYIKNFGVTRTHEGAFSARNKEIKKVLDQSFNEIIENIYKDQEISNAIRQYAR